MNGPDGVFDDLRDEGEALDALVAELDEAGWAAPTPAPGWSVAHQIAHLAWTDRQALRAATDPEGFRRETEQLRAGADPMSFVDEGAAEGARRAPAALLGEWRAARAQLREALCALPEGTRVPWFGLPMSAAGQATARIMEMWAHGEDVADALGTVREPTARLRHVVRIGVRARDFAYAVHGLTPPAGPFRVEVTGPEGQLWAHGPEDAPFGRVTGDAVEFCRLATRRVHRDDTRLRAEGEEAERWLGIAQAFAGPPGPGRPRVRDTGAGGTGGGTDDGRGRAAEGGAA